MKLDWTKSKAYGGGAGALVGVLASEGVSENITVILTWLLSFLGTPPPEVVGAIAFFVKLLVTTGITFLATYFAPPNQPPLTEADLEALKQHGAKLEQMTKSLEKEE